MTLLMKYFVLKPAPKYPNDPYALASREAMREYANVIEKCDSALAFDLRKWADREGDNDIALEKKS